MPTNHKTNLNRKLELALKLIAYILPVLLQQWNEEINTHLNILEDLLLFHSNVAHCNSHAKHLFQLELNHSLCLINFRIDGFLMCDKSWKLSCIIIINGYIRKKYIMHEGHPLRPIKKALYQRLIFNAACILKYNLQTANKPLKKRGIHWYILIIVKSIYKIRIKYKCSSKVTGQKDYTLVIV